MKYIGVNIPEDMRTVLCVTEAVRQVFQTFPESLVFDAFVDNEEIKQVLSASGKFYKVLPLESFNEDNYNLIHYVTPTWEKAKEYGIEERDKRTAIAKMYMGEEELPEVSPTPFNLIQTVYKDMQEGLRLLKEDYSPEIDIQRLKPFIHIPKKVRDYIRFLMRKHCKVGEEFIRDNTYLVVEGGEELDELCYNLPTFYVRLKEGYISGLDQKLTLLEQAALVDNANCLGYIGSNWLSYVAWARTKPILLEIASSNEDDDNFISQLWDGVRYSKAVYWDVTRGKLEDLSKEIEKFVLFKLEDQ